MNKYPWLCAALVMALRLAAAPATNAAAGGGPAAAAATNAVAGATNVAAEAEAEEVKTAFTKPTLKSVADTVKNAQAGVPEPALRAFMDMMGWDVRTERGINDFFQRSLAFTMNVVRRGNSPNVKRVIELARANPYETQQGENVVIFYPKTITVTSGGKQVRKPFGEVCPVDKIVSAADGAFTQTADALLFSPFLYWGQKARAKIFLITDAPAWAIMQRSGTRPVGVVVTEPDYREIYVHVTPLSLPFLDQAVAYAVSEQVVNEYSMIVSGKSKSQMPLFFTLGLAAEMSKLSSVLTEQGPQQVRRFGAREIGPKDILQLRKKVEAGQLQSEQLPLMSTRLVAIDRLLEATSYPSGSEDLYYMMRQDAALVTYLRENGTLAFLALARNLADGRTMDRAFDNSYAKIRTMISGTGSADKEEKERSSRARKNDKDDKRASRERKDEKSATEYSADDVLKGLKWLKSRAKDVIFTPLTEEYMKERARETSGT
jgi:hypothetical protein